MGATRHRVEAGGIPQSAHQGVTWSTDHGRWRARVGPKQLGYFEREDEAAVVAAAFREERGTTTYRRVDDGRIACLGPCGETKPLREFYPRNGKPRQWCKDCELARTAEWRKTNADHLTSYNRESYAKRRDYYQDYYRQNRERHAETQKAWWASGRGNALRRKHEGRRRALKQGAYIEHVEPDVCFQMHGGRCGICGEFIIGRFHVDHIIPLSRGGQHGYVNCQPSHPVCNQRKNNKLPEEMAA